MKEKFMLIGRFRHQLLSGFILMAVVSVGVLDQSARGGPIDVVVHTTDSSPITINATGSHMLDLTSDIANTRGPFAPLAGRPYTATFNVGSIQNLLQLSSNAPGTTISLRDPLSGQAQNFIATTKAKAETKIRRFLQQNLNTVFVGYQRTLNGNSGIGVTDGNPLAATAFLGTDAFNRFGIDPAVPVTPIGQLGDFAVGIDADGGQYRTSSLDGDFAQFDINLSERFNQLVGLVISIPLEYRTIQGTNSYAGGLNLGLPFTILTHPQDKDGFAWQLTPWAVVGGGINESLLSGGGIAGGGITSSIGYRLGNFTFTMANQGGYDGGFSFTYDNIKFNTPVDQWIFKNGLYVDCNLSHGLFVDGGASYTDFLHTAGVSGYVSPRLGAGLRWGHNGAYEARVSYIGDFGENFTANGVQAQLNLSF
jgi:hypothetical protein